jgi:hypothetical protein
MPCFNAKQHSAKSEQPEQPKSPDPEATRMVNTAVTEVQPSAGDAHHPSGVDEARRSIERSFKRKVTPSANVEERARKISKTIVENERARVAASGFRAVITSADHRSLVEGVESSVSAGALPSATSSKELFLIGSPDLPSRRTDDVRENGSRGSRLVGCESQKKMNTGVEKAILRTQNTLFSSATQPLPAKKDDLADSRRRALAQQQKLQRWRVVLRSTSTPTDVNITAAGKSVASSSFPSSNQQDDVDILDAEGAVGAAQMPLDAASTAVNKVAKIPAVSTGILASAQHGSINDGVVPLAAGQIAAAGPLLPTVPESITVNQVTKSSAVPLVVSPAQQQRSVQDGILPVTAGQIAAGEPLLPTVAEAMTLNQVAKNPAVADSTSPVPQELSDGDCIEPLNADETEAGVPSSPTAPKMDLGANTRMVDGRKVVKMLFRHNAALASEANSMARYLRERDEVHAELQDAIAWRDQQIARLTKLLTRHDEEFARLAKIRARRDEEIARLTKLLHEADHRNIERQIAIEELTLRNEEMQRRLTGVQRGFFLLGNFITGNAENQANAIEGLNIN